MHFLDPHKMFLGPVSSGATPTTASGAVAAQISRMTRRRQLSYDCCIDLSPKVFVRRTSLNTINMLTKPKARPDTPDRKHSSEKVRYTAFHICFWFRTFSPTLSEFEIPNDAPNIIQTLLVS